MKSRPFYAVAGLLVGAFVDIVITLLASAIQQRAFFDRFSGQAVWWLAGLAVLGLLIGYWLGEKLQLSEAAVHQSTLTEKPDTVTITRLRALLSYSKLKGRGIHLADIILIGSRIDIDS